MKPSERIKATIKKLKTDDSLSTTDATICSIPDILNLLDEQEERLERLERYLNI